MHVRTRLTALSRRDLFRIATAVVGVNAIGALPAVAFGADTDWFEKPWFFPPAVVFPVVWTLLFTMLGVALFLVWRAGPDRRTVRVALAAFAGQMVLNLAWTPVFFGFQEPGLGLAVIGMLWMAIVGTIAAFDRVSRPAALLFVPYLAWVTFAFVLNWAIYTG